LLYPFKNQVYCSFGEKRCAVRCCFIRLKTRFTVNLGRSVVV
jgi:hypothetical protein